MKYYTAFLFEGHRELDARGEMLHVTHKYLGELSDGIARGVFGLIASYIQMRPEFPTPPFAFTEERFFGVGNDIRVLVPGFESKYAFWPRLREALDQFRPDDYPYTPHVTTDLKAVSERISSYAFFGDGKLLHEWVAPTSALTPRIPKREVTAERQESKEL